MDYNKILNTIIDDGIKAAKEDYTEPKDKNRLDGSIAGFEACRNKTAEDILILHNEALKSMNEAYIEQANIDLYWYKVCYHLEIEWVLNVLSGINYINNTKPLLNHLPTANGVSKAFSILSRR